LRVEQEQRAWLTKEFGQGILVGESWGERGERERREGRERGERCIGRAVRNSDDSTASFRQHNRAAMCSAWLDVD
jgi:hypothetical protein